MKTWEPQENLLNIKDYLKAYIERESGADGDNAVRLRHERMRKRAKKALKKGSLEKGNKIQRIIGIRTNKFDNQLMCKISWKPVM